MSGGYDSVISLGLMEMPTNIGDIRTQGVLNSVANRETTTNVGHMAGGYDSVISLGLMNLMSMMENACRVQHIDGFFSDACYGYALWDL